MICVQCEDIYYAVYDYAWYSLKPKEAKSLMLIMIRADKPLYITAGKIFPMTLSMFCSVRQLIIVAQIFAWLRMFLVNTFPNYLILLSLHANLISADQDISRIHILIAC